MPLFGCCPPKSFNNLTNIIMFLKHSQKGITLFLVMIILAVVLAVAIGLSTILISQIKMIAGMGNSVKALYAADTGIERVLKIIIADNDVPTSQPYEDALGNKAEYKVEVFCCHYSDDGCIWTDPNDPPEDRNECPLGSDYVADPGECNATRYCIRSIGTFEDVQRAIEVSINPIGLGSF